MDLMKCVEWDPVTEDWKWRPATECEMYLRAHSERRFTLEARKS